MLVLGYIWLPFVALPIFVSLESLDRRLLEAATDLGASRWQAFRRVTLPLSLPGVVAAFLFVFIPTLGEFVTPSLVGGATGYMYGNQIVDLFGTGFPDWQTGSVLALFLLGVVARADRRLRALPPAPAGGGRTDGRRALENRRAGAAGVLRPRRRLPLRADRDPADLLVQRLGSCRRSRSAASRCTGTTSSSPTPTCRAALETSAIIAALSSIGAVAARDPRVDRARRGVASAARRPSRRCS